MKHLILLLAALSSMACAEQAAPLAPTHTQAAQLVVYMGDDTNQETDVVALCDVQTCESMARAMNVRQGAEIYYVEAR